MRDIRIEDIPPQIKEKFDQENKLNAKLEQDQALLNECGNVYIITGDTIKDWHEGGLFQTTQDIYEGSKFYDNDEQRLKLRVNRKEKIVDLMTRIR